MQLIESLELGAGDFVFLLDEKEIRESELGRGGYDVARGQAWSEQQCEAQGRTGST